MSLRQQISTFVAENFLLASDDEVSDASSLLDSGVLDSTGVMELVGFLEKQYDIPIADEDVVPENLDSIDNLVAFVKRKLVVSQPTSGAAGQ